MTTRQKKNIERDGMMLANYLLNISPDEIVERKEWLKKQSRQYLHAVHLEVNRLEVKKLMDSL